MMRSSYISPMISDSGRRPSSSAQRVVSPSGGLLRPRSESHPRQVAFFVRADCRFFAGPCAVEQIDSYEQKQAIV